MLRLLALALVAVLAGCESVNTRIQENPQVFAHLGPNTQQAIRQGQVGPGFTPEMVYMALGKPNHIETNADGQETVWTYFNFNSPSGKFFDYAANPVQLSTQVSILTQGQGFTPIAGAEDMGNGELQPSDVVGNGKGGLGQASRRKTAMEMIQSDQRQDLHLKFKGDRLVSFELEVISAG